MKPPARRLTIQKPEMNPTIRPAEILEDGFVRIGVSKIRKVYK
jgi:hypothetical protein